MKMVHFLAKDSQGYVITNKTIPQRMFLGAVHRAVRAVGVEGVLSWTSRCDNGPSTEEMPQRRGRASPEVKFTPATKGGRQPMGGAADVSE